ncbi:hypothetical protein [Actinosynnema mirum]|nr:hypothetical protein [Actinosynnema mirum]
MAVATSGSTVTSSAAVGGAAVGGMAASGTAVGGTAGKTVMRVLYSQHPGGAGEVAEVLKRLKPSGNIRVEEAAIGKAGFRYRAPDTAAKFHVGGVTTIGSDALAVEIGTTDDLPDAAFAVPVLGLVVTLGFLPG